jgi:hypothetical protein
MTPSINDDTAGFSGGTYIKGDYDPSDFSYQNTLTKAELLNLYIRNPKIQKATAWFAGEVLRERWEFEVDQPIESVKHGLPFLFKTFNTWLEWNGFIQEALKAISWSLLFGDTIIVFYDGKEAASPDKYGNGNKQYLKPATDYVKCKAFYEETKGNGYTIIDVDPFSGIPKTYKIQMHAHRAEKAITYYVDASRVVRFSAPQKELKYQGTSTVTAIAHDCLVQEQIKRAVAVQANNLQSGILALKANTDAEKDIINSAVGDAMTHLRRVFFRNNEDIDSLIKVIIPDLKIEQLEKLNKILQTDVATGMDMSISILEGAPQGAISSAAFDTFNTYSKVKQLQSHYTRAMEESFFKFGKLDTTFTWNDPMPKGDQKEASPKSDEQSQDKEENNDNEEHDNDTRSDSPS